MASDNVFGEDSGALQLATTSGDADAGYQATLVVRIDTTTEPTGGGAPVGDARPEAGRTVANLPRVDPAVTTARQGRSASA